MTDTDGTTTATNAASEDSAAVPGGGSGEMNPEPDGGSPVTVEPSRLRSILLKGALVLLALLAVIAALRLYLSASTAIEIWVARDYQPLVQAAFNLVVLALTGIGIVALTRRLTDE